MRANYALGGKPQTRAPALRLGRHVRFGSIASFWRCPSHFRSTPIIRHHYPASAYLNCANTEVVTCLRSCPLPSDHAVLWNFIVWLYGPTPRC